MGTLRRQNFPLTPKKAVLMAVDTKVTPKEESQAKPEKVVSAKLLDNPFHYSSMKRP